MDERAFYKESQTTKPITLNCPMCRSVESYDLKWLVRTKVDRLPGNADERDRATFKTAASYMVLLDDKVMCKNMRCRKRFDVFPASETCRIYLNRRRAVRPESVLRHLINAARAHAHARDAPPLSDDPPAPLTVPVPNGPAVRAALPDARLQSGEPRRKDEHNGPGPPRFASTARC